MHQFAEQQKIDVAVDEAHAGRSRGRRGASEPDAGRVARPSRGKRDVGFEPGEMREQIANGDVAFAALKFRDVLRDLVVELKFSLLEKLHERRRGGDHLRERCDIEPVPCRERVFEEAVFETIESRGHLRLGGKARTRNQEQQKQRK